MRSFPRTNIWRFSAGTNLQSGYTGWQADEVINLKGSGVLQTTFPEGLSREAIAKDIFEKGSWEGELIQRAKDGRDVTVYAKSMALKDEAGVVIGGVSISYDITERKQMEEALRDNREDFDRAQTVGNIGSWRLDVRRNELTWSDENHRIFGIPKGTPLTYEIFLSMVHPDDREYVDDEWKAGLAGEPYDIEHRIIADGKIKWVREKAYIEFDKDGALLGGFGITQDITERKQAEEELRDSEERFRTMANAIPQLAWIARPDGYIYWYNERWYSYTGTTPSKWKAGAGAERAWPDGASNSAGEVAGLDCHGADVWYGVSPTRRRWPFPSVPHARFAPERRRRAHPPVVWNQHRHHRAKRSWKRADKKWKWVPHIDWKILPM